MLFIILPICATLQRGEKIQARSKIIQNWNRFDNGFAFNISQAEKVLGKVTHWDSGRAKVVDKSLMVTIPSNTLSKGLIANVKLEPSMEYVVSYDIRFDENFDWSRGGKVGFGFAFGNANAGGKRPVNGEGGTFRLCWRRFENKQIAFHPYLYFIDQEGQYGDIPSRYPINGSLEKNKWYRVVMRMKCNTFDNKDGRAFLSINGETVLDVPIRWTNNDSKRLINRLTFHTFRGGGDKTWLSSTDGYVFYDNLKVNRISK